MTTSKLPPLFAALILLLPIAPACSDADTDAPETPAAASVPADLFVSTAPADAIGVRAAKTKADVGEPITVRGVIGGRSKPFVNGRAVMIIIDTELKPCGADEGCPTPWDYCCETKEDLLANTATVQVVDADGSPLRQTLDGVQGLAALRTVTVTGTVRSTEGGLVIDAAKVHVAGS